MVIEIHGDEWTAHILMSENFMPERLKHVEAKVNGINRDVALDGARFVLNMLAKGRLAFIRTPPEVSTYKDFDAKKEQHWGFVRFSFSEDGGEWKYADKELVPLRSFGEQH